MRGAVSAETAAILRRARERISDPARWCKGAFSSNAMGQRCVDGPTASGARAWCASGSVLAEHADNVGGEMALTALRHQVRRSTGLRITIAAYNDDPSTTHADILALYDRAIAAEEASP